jgi:hypothetical protein
MLADRNDQSVGEVIPESLRYEGASKSSVITQRSTVKFYPTSGMNVKSSENKVTILRLSSSDFIDPRTATLDFRLSVPDPKIVPEDLLQSLIQSMSLQIGGVEISHVDNYGEAYKMLAYSSCPKHVYDHGWHANMGSYKYRQCKRANIYQGADHDGTDMTSADATNKVILGQIYDHTSYPAYPDENQYYTTYGDGKQGKWCSIPLAELLGFFKIKTLIAMPFLGSVDITIHWADFNKAMLVHSGLVRDAATGIVSNADVDLGANLDYYKLDDITVSCDTCALDRTFVSLLSGLVSSSPAGITMPFEDMATSVKSFDNAGTNSIYISKGVSYLKKLFWGLRSQKHVNNRFVDKSQFKFADAFRGGSYQVEIGSRLFPENRVTSTSTAFVELTKAVDSIGHFDQGGVINDECYHGVVNGTLTEAPYVPDPTAPVKHPHCYRETPQAFIMGQNLERAMGAGSLSGLSLKLSGYSIHLQLALRQSAAESQFVDNMNGLTAVKNRLRYEPNLPLWNQQMNLLTCMLYDKSVVLRQDAITVSE